MTELNALLWGFMVPFQSNTIIKKNVATTRMFAWSPIKYMAKVKYNIYFILPIYFPYFIG